MCYARGLTTICGASTSLSASQGNMNETKPENPEDQTFRLSVAIRAAVTRLS